MKKKIFAAFIAVLLLCAPLVACGESFKNPKLDGKQDTSYVVISNGGSAVQYGNYVYYINGYRGYDDENGAENYWGNVVKGGLYRSELNAGKIVDTYEYMTAFGTTVGNLKTFESRFDEETLYDFVLDKNVDLIGYEKDAKGDIVYDDNDKPIEIWADAPKADRIASKTIGTSGYDKGGIFIYDEYVYYATPSNKQSKTGEFETDKTMFFRTKLDGSETKRLYTSKNATNNSEYAFYNQNGKVYLTVHDGTDIISVKIGSKKVESVSQIATDVSAVLFPVKDIYYKGIDTNQAEDFIYYTREINEDDSVRAGNIVVAMRPNGSEKMEILTHGNTITLKNVDNGYLFYEDARAGGNVIMYTNLHNEFMEHSSSYKAAYEKNADAIAQANGGANSPLLGHQSGVALDVDNISSYSETISFRPSGKSTQVYTLCMSSSGLYMYDGSDLVNIYSGSVAQVYTVKGQYVYFRDSSGNFYFTNAYVEAKNNEVVTLAESMSTSATFTFDLIGEDFVMMFGEVDEYASDYAFFVNLKRLEDKKQFVGAKADEDKYDASVELNPSESTDDDITVDNAD